MISSSNGEPIVLTAALITVASTTGGDLRQGKSIDPKKVVGGLLAMCICGVLAEMDAELGAGLAIAIAGTAFITYGLPAISGSSTPIQSATGPATKHSSRTSILKPKVVYKGAVNSGLTSNQAHLLAGQLPNGQRIG